jgi:hypothetical protein
MDIKQQLTHLSTLVSAIGWGLYSAPQVCANARAEIERLEKVCGSVGFDLTMKWHELERINSAQQAEVERLVGEVRMERQTRAQDRQEFAATIGAMRQALDTCTDQLFRCQLERDNLTDERA